MLQLDDCIGQILLISHLHVFGNSLDTSLKFVDMLLDLLLCIFGLDFRFLYWSGLFRFSYSFKVAWLSFCLGPIRLILQHLHDFLLIFTLFDKFGPHKNVLWAFCLLHLIKLVQNGFKFVDTNTFRSVGAIIDGLFETIASFLSFLWL